MQPPSRENLGDVLRRWQGGVVSDGTVPVTVGFSMAATILDGNAGSLHSAPITRRIPRQHMLLIPTQPSAQAVNAWLQGMAPDPAQIEVAIVAQTDLPKWADNMLEPALVLNWLDASSYIKDNRQAPKAMAAFARLIGGNRSGAALARSVQAVSYTTLRGARIKLDVVAMMAMRALWRWLMATNPDNLHVYIHCDASPQKGAELFATTVDIFDGKVSRRCLLPCVALDAALLDAQGKTLAILWQLSGRNTTLSKGSVRRSGR